MENFEIATGKTVDEAVEKACANLGVTRENVEIDVLELPSKKLFGLKTVPAKVKVTLNEEYTKKFEKKAAAETKEKPVKETAEKKETVKETKPAEKKQEKAETKPCENKPECGKKKKECSEKPAEKKESVKEKKAEEEVKEEKAEEVKMIDPAVLELKGSESAAYVKDVLLAFGYEDAQVSYSQKDGMIVLQLSGESLSGDSVGSVVGRKGDNLDALQYLASLVANRSEGSYVRVVLDIDGYRDKREESLKAYARKMAAQAVRSKRSIALEPMNPYERRIVHSTVQTVNGATSKSIGTEPNRKVIISPIDGGKGRRDSRRDGNRGNRNQHHDSSKAVSKTVTTAVSEEPKNDTSAISLYGRINLD